MAWLTSIRTLSASFCHLAPFGPFCSPNPSAPFSPDYPPPPPPTLPLNCGPRIFLVGTVCSTGQSPLGCPCSAWRSLVAAVPFRPPLASRPLLAPVILPVVPTCGRALSASFSLLAPFGPRYSACCPYWPLFAHCHPLFASLAPFSLVAALPYCPLIAYWLFLAP